ncbi:MAG: hypothetical protein WCE68_15685 [Anaerolineales bacterium]
MEFFINDPLIERQPPVETRLLDLRAEPDPNGQRLRVALELTPFQQRPDIELSLTNSTGSEVASASIIEPVGWKLELTLHIRTIIPTAEKYTLAASLSYPGLGEVDRRTLIIEIPIPAQ